LAPLAMEMLRDIDEDTVDFGPNYDGDAGARRSSRRGSPNLLVNGSDGIAVGFATTIPAAQPARDRAGRPSGARSTRTRRGDDPSTSSSSR
jgi:hypothetical protein